MTRIVLRIAITKQNFEQLFNRKALEDQAGEVYDAKSSFYVQDYLITTSSHITVLFSFPHTAQKRKQMCSLQDPNMLARIPSLPSQLQ